MEINDRIIGCIQIEQTVASIYDDFVNRFPVEKDFWKALYYDEIEHASLLSNEIASGLSQDTSLPNSAFIEKTMEFALNIKEQIQFKTFSFEEALKISLILEEAMVETFTNEVVYALNSSDDKFFNRKVNDMLVEEKGHVSKIKNMMIRKGYLKMS